MPTVIKLFPGIKDQIGLQRYLGDESVRNPQGAFHSTLWHSVGPLFKNKEIENSVMSQLPLTINPPYELDSFGNLLVLKYTSKGVEGLRNKLLYERERQIINLPDGVPEGGWEMIKQSQMTIPHNVPLQDGSHRGVLVESRKEQKVWLMPELHITLAKGIDNYLLRKISDYENPITFEGLSWDLKYNQR